MHTFGGGCGIGGSLGADASSHSILDKIGQVEDNLDRLSDKGNTYTFTVDVGGSGGDGGGGGDVNLTYGGQIATAGDLADAIVLQSISGGGGQGGSSSASGSQVQANIAVGVGGKGGTSDNAGTITTYFNDSNLNSVNTNGYGSVGVLMQSIGGGGGQGGDGSDQAEGDITVGGSAGGTGGTGGGGGLIQSTPGNDSGWVNLTTQGDEAHGLVAQSIGGGGGIASTGTVDGVRSATVGGTGGAAGDGAFQTFTHAGFAAGSGAGGGFVIVRDRVGRSDGSVPHVVANRVADRGVLSGGSAVPVVQVVS